MLPAVRTDEEWQAVVFDEKTVRPAAEDLAARLGLAGAALRRYPGGSRPVYAVGDRRVLKLYPTVSAPDSVTEARVLDHAFAGRLNELRTKLEAAIELDNVVGFKLALAELRARARSIGRPVTADPPMASDLIVPPRGAAIDVARRLLACKAPPVQSWAWFEDQQSALAPDPSVLPDLVVRTRCSDHQMKAGTTYRVGRDRKSDIVMTDSRVSWRHAELRVDGDVWIIEDLGSTNGTFVGLERLDRIQISADCVVRLGNPDDGPLLRCMPQVPAAPPARPPRRLTIRVPSCRSLPPRRLRRPRPPPKPSRKPARGRLRVLVAADPAGIRCRRRSASRLGHLWPSPRRESTPPAAAAAAAQRPVRSAQPPPPNPWPAVAGSHDQFAGRARFDAFISYRRLPADTAFVDQLQEALAERGMNVWVDRTDIEPAADWSERILRGIEAAKAFIFVITPESVVSEQCLRELETAVQRHKLIIPVALRNTDRRDLPGSLLTPNWIFFFGPGHDLQRGLDNVITALEEDLGWRDMHTRLVVRAKEWSDSHQDRGFLLRGSDLRSAEEWLGQATMHDKTPPTALQTEYILASRKATTRTQRTWRTALSVGLIISLSLAALAFVQRQQAVYERQQAIHQRDVAVSGELASRSEALGDTDPVISKLLSIAAWRIKSLQRRTLRDADRGCTARDPHPHRPHRPGRTRWRSARTARPWPAAAGDDTIRLWDVATGRPIGNPLTGHTDQVLSVAFSPDGKTLASGSVDDTVRLWDVATGRPIGQPLTGHAGAVDSVAFSPDGKTLASGSADDTIRLWDVATGRPIGQPLTGHTDEVNSVAFSPDGKTLASGSLDDTVRLWDVATGRPIGKPLTGHTEAVWSVAFSPDGKTLASGSSDDTVRLWDVATGRPIGQPLTGHTGQVYSVAFSPDGKTLASGSRDDTVRLWDVATGRPIGNPLTGHTEAVWSVAFSPDGKTLASGSFDHTIRLWDVATGRPIGQPLTGHTGSVNPVAFSPDGKTLASGSTYGADDTVRLWDVVTGRPPGTP